MPLQKLEFAPGIYADGSPYSATGRWVDCDKIRFRLPQPEKIGGWVLACTTPFLGVARYLRAWSDLSGGKLLAVGTNLKVYIETGGDLYDITPIRASSTINNNPFSTTSGTPLIVVTDSAHGAVDGDFVTYSGATAVGGFTTGELNAEHQIETVIDGNSYRIRMDTNASSTATGGGAAVVAAYQINTGLTTAVSGVGWGAGGWGGVTGAVTTGWGESAPLTAAGTTLRLWSMDSFGQNLIFNPRDGGLFYWDRSGGFSTRGVYLDTLAGATAVPSFTKQILVSESDRKLLCFGTSTYDTDIQDPLLIRWSDTEAPQDLEPTETNAAGGFRIPLGTQFIQAIETKQEILVWSDTALHSMRYIGPPLIYGITAVGNTTILSPNAAAAANDAVFWMGDSGFFTYNGTIINLPCPVQDYVFNRLDWEQAEKVVSGTLMSHNEVWWFYPAISDGADPEINSYVVYNYGLNVWYYGSLSRTYWMDSGANQFPIAAATDGFLYQHETGLDDGSVDPPQAITSYIISAPIEIDVGERFGFISRMIPDLTFRNSTATLPTVDFVLTGYNTPGGGVAEAQTDSNMTTGTALIPVARFTTMTYPRLRARSVTLSVASAQEGVTWRLGTPRIDVRQDGRR